MYGDSTHTFSTARRHRINKAKVENSQPKRAQMYAQAMTLIFHDIPSIWLAHAKVPMLARKNADGLFGQPGSNEHWKLVSLR
jgi:hypothetical protein